MSNDVTVRPGATLTVKRRRTNARPSVWRTVVLTDATFIGQAIYGDLIDRFDFQRWPDPKFAAKMTPVLMDEESGFVVWAGNDDDGLPVYESVNGKTFKAAYIVDSTIYVSRS